MFKPLSGSEGKKWLEEKYAELDCDIDGDCKGVQSNDNKTKADTQKTWSKCSSREKSSTADQQGRERKHTSITVSSPRKRNRAREPSPDVEIIEEDKDNVGNESMFKPFSGSEEAKRLEVKYSEVFEENDDYSITSDDLPQIYTPKKPRLTFLSTKKSPEQSKKASRGKSKKSDAPQHSPKKKQNYGGHDFSSDSESDGDERFTNIKHTESDTNKDRRAEGLTAGINCLPTGIDCPTTDKEASPLTEGYNEEDFEKPKFKGRTPSAAKVPFKLSSSADVRQVEVPAPLNQYLRDYQREGIQFLYDHYKEGEGAVLGDDMGLGKTVQVIGLVAALLGKKCNKTDIKKQKPRFIREMSDGSLEEKIPEDTYKCRPFLIIGPGSVLYNWMDELEAWGYFSVGKYHGSEKAECLSKLSKQSLEVVVTTFETFRENTDELNSVKWEAVIADEVHRIKGLQAQVTQALRTIRTPCRYGLTGTALQNNMTELWSILDWVQPGCLGNIDTFTAEYVVPIETGQKQDASKRELATARKAKEKFASIRNKIMIRRTKQLIADQLPKKDDNVVFCRLSDLQEKVYRFILKHPGLVHVMSMDDPCPCGSGEPRKYCCKQVTKEVTVTGLQFIFMHLLLKVSNHAALLIESPHRQLSKFSKMICKAVFAEFPQFFSDTKESAFRTLSDPKYCGKMKILQKLLKVFQKDHSKVLIFSYSTRVLDIIDQYLITTGYEYRRLDGSTSMAKRMMLVREFNRDPNIFLFLISAKAGGLGLNLTGANRVIIFDPSWNPTNDLQAQDRAYRIGQWRDVHVYRLISAGTIEENIYLRQVYKQQLDSVVVGTENARRYFKGVAGNRKRYGELFGIKNMFQLHAGDITRTMDILKKNENLERSLTEFRIAEYVPGRGRRVSMEDNLLEDKSEDSQSEEEEEEDYLSRYLDLHHSDSEAEEVKSKKTEGHVTRNRASKGENSPIAQGTLAGDEDVLHVLKNRQIVGGSRAEDHMSRCAIQDVFELHQNSQAPAAFCQPLSEPESEEEIKEIKKPKSYSTTIGRNYVLVGQTPPAIRIKQFGEMVKFNKKQTMEEFAEEILRSSPDERRDLLKSYYMHVHPDVSPVFQGASVTTIPKSTAKKGNSSTAERQKRKKKAQILGDAIKVSPKQTATSVLQKEKCDRGDMKRSQPAKEVKKNKTPLFVPSYVNEETLMETSPDSFEISTDDLLQEIYNQKEETAAKEKEETEMKQEKEGPNTSVLDELFSPSLMERIKRKPAPKKGVQKKTGSDDLFSDSSSAKEDIEEVIRPDNTLKDDDFDCFSDPSRKKRKKSKAQMIVSRLIKESEDAYNQLPVVPIGSDLDEVDSCDRSPSLF